ncbi:MAG: helicase associated domain-containing protein [Acidimicrobiia bacterium]|nr:helicase associated domain-containing protein [Acidimicrobiia bacterium]
MPSVVANVPGKLGGVADARARQWEEWLGLLATWRARMGHADVPQRTVIGGRRLGRWLARQRRLHSQGLLAPERERALGALGVSWSRPRLGWAEWFVLLESFVAREGHAAVPRGHREGGYDLGAWAASQRAAWRRGALNPARARRLEALGCWGERAAWERWAELLERFVAREGHGDVPHRHLEDGQALGRWLARQRSALAHGLLSAQRRDRLDAATGRTWRAPRRSTTAGVQGPVGVDLVEHVAEASAAAMTLRQMAQRAAAPELGDVADAHDGEEVAGPGTVWPRGSVGVGRQGLDAHSRHDLARPGGNGVRR